MMMMMMARMVRTQVRKSLESRLFVAKPDFCYALVDFHSKLTDLKVRLRVRLLSVIFGLRLLTGFVGQWANRRRTRHAPCATANARGESVRRPMP
jgi:hypothetical protein